MKKVFSMICALSLAMSTMFVSTMAEAATFVDDNQPRIITDCTKITSKGLATIDFYLDFGKYDFATKYESGSSYDEEMEEDVISFSAKGLQAVQVDVPVSQFVGDLVASTNPIVANEAASFPNVSAAYNTSAGNLTFFFYASSINDVYVPTGKVKLFTAKVYVSDTLVDTDKTGALVDANIDITLSNAKVTVWTLDDKVSTNDFTENAYNVNNIDTIFGDADNAIVTIGDAAGKVAEANGVTGKVWNDVKIEEAAKGTNYKAVFTNGATTKEFAFDFDETLEADGDISFAVVLKLVEQAANAADILMDVVCTPAN